MALVVSTRYIITSKTVQFAVRHSVFHHSNIEVYFCYHYVAVCL